LDVVSNLMLSAYDRKPFARWNLMMNQVCREHAVKKSREYQVKTPSVKSPVRQLSGGNQQKLILARELEGRPKLIIACQPTRGLDIGAEEFVHKILLKQKRRGVGILLISVDLDQIMALSDRIAVIFEGRITGMMKNDGKIDLSQIGLKMAGFEGTT
jgi:simple sugar transport system ATP-binding protein